MCCRFSLFFFCRGPLLLLRAKAELVRCIDVVVAESDSSISTHAVVVCGGGRLNFSYIVLAGDKSPIFRQKNTGRGHTDSVSPFVAGCLPEVHRLRSSRQTGGRISGIAVHLLGKPGMCVRVLEMSSYTKNDIDRYIYIVSYKIQTFCFMIHIRIIDFYAFSPCAVRVACMWSGLFLGV